MRIFVADLPVLAPAFFMINIGRREPVRFCVETFHSGHRFQRPYGQFLLIRDMDDFDRLPRCAYGDAQRAACGNMVVSGFVG